MRMRLHVTTIAQCPELERAIVDRWFVLEEVEHDEVSRTVTIPLWRARVEPAFWGERHSRGDTRHGRLVVDGVRSLLVEDEAGIGDYPVDFMLYEETVGGARVVIESSFPLRLTLVTDGVDIRLLES